MNKKAVLVIGIIAVVGIGYYLYSKSKTTSAIQGDVTDEGQANTTKSASASPTKKELRAKCGRKPILAKKRAEWQKCIDAGGVSSFDADYGL